MASASTVFTASAVAGLLVFGSLNTITMKVAFSMESVGSEDEEHYFQKPWFVTLVMFVAMSIALLVDALCGGKKRGSADNGYQSMADPSPTDSGMIVESSSSLKKKMLVSIPASFDIIATGLCGMGFVFIPASVWQLLRGAEVIFAALFAVVFLKRQLYTFHYVGLALCVAGISTVGMASVWGAESAEAGPGARSANLMILGISLALAGQVVQAAQVIAEEWLLKDMDLPALQVIGYEGVWGVLLFLVFATPLLYIIPGSDNGHFEDEWDAVVMMTNNTALATIMALYTFSCFTYNMSGIYVTEALSAVHRVMLEALRTCIVWVFGLCVHYFFDPTSKFGESITPYSWLEVVGFVLLVLGQAVYGEILTFKCFYYPPASDEAMLVSAGNVRNLATPLPAK